MPSITIGVNDFVKGVSTSDNLPDAGFSNLSKGQNLLTGGWSSTVGAISSQCKGTDLTGAEFVNGEKVITCIQDHAFSGNSLYFATMNSIGANFFKLPSTTGNPTLEQTDDANVRAYQEGKSDMIYFKGMIYVSSDRDIAQLNNNFATVDVDWWSTTGGTTTLESGYGVSHLMIEFDNKMWIADAVNNGKEGTLHSWDGTTGIEDVINFGQGTQITALGKYETTGDMLIATTPTADYSGTKGFRAKLFIWDGFSPNPNREIILGHERITALKTVGGITYVFYGQNFGYFNGNGITFLRRLKIQNSGTTLINPHKVTDANGILYIAEEGGILAYGKLYGGGNRVFYYPYTEDAAAWNRFQVIIHLGKSSNKTYLAAFWLNDNVQEGQLTQIDLDNIETGSSFHSNKYYLPSNSIIKKVEVITDKLVSSDNIGFELYKSSDESFVSIGTMEFSNDGAVAQKTLGKNKKIETSVIQVKATWTAGIPAIKQIKIYYDAIEKEL